MTHMTHMIARDPRHPIFTIAFWLWIVAIALPAFGGAAAANQIIDGAKAQGLIGETVEGYLAVRDPATPDNVRREVNRVNIERRAAYADLAEQSGVSLEIAAALTAEKLIQRANLS